MIVISITIKIDLSFNTALPKQSYKFCPLASGLCPLVTQNPPKITPAGSFASMAGNTVTRVTHWLETALSRL